MGSVRDAYAGTSEVSGLLESGDTRWIHRAAYDLMGYRRRRRSRHRDCREDGALYGSLPEQLKENSFVSGCATSSLSARDGIATSSQVDVPAVPDKAMLVMVHLLHAGRIHMTVLNFSSRTITGDVTSRHLTPGGAVIDTFTDQEIARVNGKRTFSISLEPHQGMSLLAVPNLSQAGEFDVDRIEDESASGHGEGRRKIII